MNVNKEDLYFYGRVALALLVGFLVVYPLYLYGRHFFI